MQAFKDASLKVGRVDRDLQEIFDAVLYIVEELNHGESDTALETVISDFNYILEKGLKAIFLSSDSATSSYQTPHSLAVV